MRWIALLILCAACADKYGAFLDVDGKGAVVFDRVEFYFGKEVGGPLPTSPRHPTLTPGLSVVVKRQFAEADVVSIGSAVGTFTYYVPDQPGNESLGHYVAVLAFSGDQLVGIGELFDFDVTTEGAVYRYPIELVDARSQDIEQWGRPTPDCLRWTRDRGAGHPRTVAVVREDDADCDDYAERDGANSDCMPRVYCDGATSAGCEAQITCVTTSGGSECRVGVASCSNLTGTVSTCATSVCVDEIACDDCRSGGDVISCVVMDNNIHVDSQIIVNPDYTLCAKPFELDMILPPGIDCLNPAILGVEDYMPMDKFNYSIAPGTANTCRLTITPEKADAHFTTVPHMLIAIDTPAGALARTAFVLGLQATDGPCQSPAAITPQLSFGSCLP